MHDFRSPVIAGHPYGMDAPESEMIFIFWPTVLSVALLLMDLVCLSVCLSVTFCILAKWYVLAKNCLKEQIELPTETTNRYQFGPPFLP